MNPTEVPPNGLQLVPGLWFEDGNVIIQAETDHFRIYRGVLAARSPIFNDMLGLPQPQELETLEGCPVVRLPDAALEVAAFLRALFDSAFFEPYPSPSEFHIIAGILRLSHKYDVAYLRHRALVHLSSLYSTTLDEWDLQLTSWPASTSMFAIELAREVGAEWILPVAFYNLAAAAHNLGMKEIIAGTAFGSFHVKLGAQDLAHFLEGYLLQRDNETSTMLRFLHSPVPVIGCTGGSKCTLARLIAVTQFQADRVEYPAIPLDIWGQTDWTRLSAACSTCLKALKYTHAAARESFWDKLPGLYGLLEWDELRKMKTQGLKNDPEPRSW
ncbi:hypothetical protein B0H17DRAFT_936866 [Mycena rosella]|uniref:BTB domain-containing protein n=1 Tax=Mycena rosella TaxID=1033263 RepID=A0AAD7GIR2_MYCRO|nr:hypothetical protein B0H17DRAFT_936866 [Mycena rosella]